MTRSGVGRGFANESGQEAPNAPPEESRRYVRGQTNQPVWFAVDDGPKRSGTCRNISLEGALVDTPGPAPFGASVTLFIQLPGIEGTTTLSGVVRWVRPDSMGIQLGLYGARVTHAIIRILAPE